MPRFWEQVRRDFPAARYPLWDLVSADWFQTQGWFAARGTTLEEQLVERLAADGGDDGGVIRADLERLRQARAGSDDRGWLDLCVKTSVLASLRGDLGRLRAAVSQLGQSLSGPLPRGRIARLSG